MLGPPARPLDPINLADWIEIRALLRNNGRASFGDIERVLRAGGVAEDLGKEPEVLGRKAFEELDSRATASAEAYPFELKGDVLSGRGAWIDFVPYVFCLLLSYVGYTSGNAERVKKTAKLFEEVASVACASLLDGDSVVFGFPRKGRLSRGFRPALNELCDLIGEGGGCIPGGIGPTAQLQDGGLDIVSWFDFPDRLHGKLLVFGQCASGENWKYKARELSAHDFCKKWMRASVASPILEAFFIPHRIDPSRWREISIDAGILFDRCRIALCAQGHLDGDDHLEWVKKEMRELMK